jgi:hypothetical protein
MRYLIVPVLFVVFVAAPAAHAQGIEDFKSFSRAIGKEVSLVDRSGVIREGIVEAATADAVTLRFGSATSSFLRAEIASAERLKDQSSDGAIKGALWGLLVIVLPNQGYASAGDAFAASWRIVAGFTVAGYLLDAAQTHRQPLYRAPSASPPTLKVSLRF